ncbi:MAG TPA: hydrogenase maturation protease [Actinocrinis sp.]|nr:hydrogenase maturation protease [Actinocrinis sp.]
MTATGTPASPDSTPQTIVIGVGTDLRGDDGFGAAVLDGLRTRPGLTAYAQLAVCDGEPARLIDLWRGYRHALIVDAVRGGGERYGFVYRRDLTAMIGAGESRTEPRGNSHAAGLGAAVRLGQVLDRLPGRLILYAVHGRDFRLGVPLSDPVATAVPELVNRIAREILGVLSAAPDSARARSAGRPAPGAESIAHRG